jgi:Flp pilus assembly protein TadG
VSRRHALCGRDERGAAAVEFALIVGVLVLVVFGIIEFGRAYSEVNVMQGAAREGARLAAVRADRSEVVARVRLAAAPYRVDGTPSVSTTCDEDTTGDPVTVSWTQTIEFDIPMLPGGQITKPGRIQGVFRCE